MRVVVLLFVGWKIFLLGLELVVLFQHYETSFQGDTDRGDSNSCLLGMDSEAKGINSWNWDFFNAVFSMLYEFWLTLTCCLLAFIFFL